MTYSAGQWGGTRAAVSMRTFLAELGCLPVSAMIHVPHAQDVFTEPGGYIEGVDGDRWNGYVDRTLDQRCLWAKAAVQQRAHEIKQPAPFVTSPAEHNAPLA